jgi:ribosome biogenesis protein ENP2
MAVGNSIGKINVYDLRNPKPLYTINHSYRLPIKKIKFQEHSQNIITVDKKLAKFSNMKTGKAFTNIETKNDINDFEPYLDTGMFFFACESENMEIYFIPGIGPAPKWCSFLENITEELEEAKNYSVYEDYKFLTLDDLEQMGANNLIGTKMVKPYMHGYFMDWKLYKKLKSVSHMINMLKKERKKSLKNYLEKESS